MSSAVMTSPVLVTAPTTTTTTTEEKENFDNNSGENNNSGGGTGTESDGGPEDHHEEEEDHANLDDKERLFLAAKTKAKIQRQRSRQKGRKRKKSTSGGDSNYVPPYKKRYKKNKTLPSTLPSKFLLGGSISDPLNLAALTGDVTPKASPLQHDPSNAPGDQVDSQQVTHSGKKSRKHRNRRRNGRKRTESESTNPDYEEDELNSKTVANPMEEHRGRDAIDSASAPEFNTTTEDEDSPIKRKSAPKEPPEEVNSQAKRELFKDREEEQGYMDFDDLPVITSDPEVEEKLNTEELRQMSVSEDGGGASKPEIEAPRTQLEQPHPPPIVGYQPSYIENPVESPPVARSGKSSEYVPLSSYYAPSPFIYDTYDDSFELKTLPFESPSLTNYLSYAENNNLGYAEPFSPPPPVGEPYFQQRRPHAPPTPPPLPSQPHGSMAQTRPKWFHRPGSFFNEKRRIRNKSRSDPIVSPVIPQPIHNTNNKKNKHHKKPTESHPNPSTSTAPADKGASGGAFEEKGSKKDKRIFQYGNYNQYYGYRNEMEDLRLKSLVMDWFEGKRVLDIGCNIGHITLSIARDFAPRNVLGIDIDPKLIGIAKKNVKHYIMENGRNEAAKFPHSLPLIYGPLCPVAKKDYPTFPFNIQFRQENYVFETDKELENVKPEYDVILCLSVTKWIHLNFGDEGMKRFFRRIFAHLHPGGKLLLEPQPWSSYKKKKKLTPKIFEVFKTIKFHPGQFQNYLLKEVGFASCENVDIPAHHSKGFQRPILLFSKADSESEQNMDNGAAATGTNEPSTLNSMSVDPTL